MSDLLKEAIADAQLVRETALANAKLALQEAFEPKLQSMLTQKLREEDADDSSANEDDSDDGVALSEVIKELEEELDIGEDVADVTESEEEEVSDSDDDDAHDEVSESKEEVSDYDDDDDDCEEVTESKEEVSDSDDEIDIEIEDDEEDVSEEVTLEDILKEADDTDDEIDIEIEDDEEDVSEEVTLEDILKEADDTDEELDIEIEDDVETSTDVSESNCDDDDEDVDLDEVLSAIREEESVDESNAEIATLKEQNETLKTENAEFRKVYKYLRGKLNEVNLLNAKLLYTNKLFKEFKLNNAQKVKVVETFDLTESVREAKLVYSTLGESFKLAEVSVKKPAKTQEITEGLASAKVESTKPAKEILSEGNDMAARFKKLAGITKS